MQYAWVWRSLQQMQYCVRQWSSAAARTGEAAAQYGFGLLRSVLTDKLLAGQRPSVMPIACCLLLATKTSHEGQCDVCHVMQK